MELKLTNSIETKPIEFNFEEIKSYLVERVEYYKNAIYTEDMIAEAKSDKAMLNNLAKQINSERIAIGREYDKPLVALKDKCDELIKIINEGSDCIKRQTDAYEKKRVDERRAELTAYWEEIATDLLKTIPYDRIEVKSWLNASTQIKKAKAEMDGVIQGIRNDLTVLKNLSSEDVDELILYYYETLSLSQTLQENEKRKARAAQIAKMKAEREEAERRAEEERRVAQERAEFIRAEQERGETEIPKNPFEIEPAQEEEPEPQLATVAFKATGTEEQIRALKRFIVDNGIKISKI